MDVQKEIELLNGRNTRVERDKAWEVSWTRRTFITLLTYGVAGLWLAYIDVVNPWLSALIPSGAYLFSTLSLPFIKNWWVKYVRK